MEGHLPRVSAEFVPCQSQPRNRGRDSSHRLWCKSKRIIRPYKKALSLRTRETCQAGRSLSLDCWCGMELVERLRLQSLVAQLRLHEMEMKCRVRELRCRGLTPSRKREALERYASLVIAMRVLQREIEKALAPV